MSHMVCPKIPHFLQMTLANQTSMVSSGFSSAMLEKTRGYPSKIWLMSATFDAWDKAPSPYQAVERASRFVDTVYNAQWTYIYIYVSCIVCSIRTWYCYEMIYGSPSSYHLLHHSTTCPRCHVATGGVERCLRGFRGGEGAMWRSENHVRQGLMGYKSWFLSMG